MSRIAVGDAVLEIHLRTDWMSGWLPIGNIGFGTFAVSVNGLRLLVGNVSDECVVE